MTSKLSTLALLALLAAGPAFAQATPDASGAATSRSGRAPRSAAPREPTAGQMAARERQKKCGVEWKAAKAGGTTDGLKWPQYWSRCNARLKGNQA